MPSPLELLLDPVSLTIIGFYSLLMLWELLFPAKKLPTVKNWQLKGIFFFFLYFYISSYLPLLYDPYIQNVNLLDISGLGIAGSAITGILLYEGGMYFWHRAMHKNDTLWRIFHQMHHSAERVDTFGTFYFNPMDILGWTVLGTICFSLILGMSPQATTIALLATSFLGIFQHANIKTPVWLGYIIQRPESHAYHHARGIHKNNYSDIPLFDIIFGTFTNPGKHPEMAGFYDGASSKMKEMLTFQDISSDSSKNT